MRRNVILVELNNDKPSIVSSCGVTESRVRL